MVEQSVPMGSSFLDLALASLSSLMSRAWAMRSRLESRDLACRELTSPPRFLDMILRVLCNDVGIFAIVLLFLEAAMNLSVKHGIKFWSCFGVELALASNRYNFNGRKSRSGAISDTTNKVVQSVMYLGMASIQ